MAELAPKDKLLPSLLDRLTDHHPGKEAEARDARATDIDSLRLSVLRDLEWLMNTTNLENHLDMDERFAELKSTVINYGMPSLSGNTISNHDKVEIQKLIKEAIIAFEPRILKNTIKVKFLDVEESENPHAISYEIHGTLWGNPLPEALYLRTELDLEMGDVVIKEL